MDLKKNLSTRNALLSANSFDQDVAKSSIAKMIVLYEYLLSMVEHVEFKEFMSII